MNASVNNMNKVLNKILNSDEALEVLEAGCGSAGFIRMKCKTHMTGVDISYRQLIRNNYVEYKIQADIHYLPVMKEMYDIVVSWDVLEHLKNPKLAINNMLGTVKNGGLLIIKMPYLMSIKGILTKTIPHKLHKLVYKYIYEVKDPGIGDTGPFKVYFKPSMMPKKITEQLRNNNMALVYSCVYGKNEISKHLRTKSRLVKYLGCIYPWLVKVISYMTLNVIKDSEVILIYQKSK